MISEIKEHRKDIENELTQAVTEFFKKTEGNQPSSVSIQVNTEALQKTVIHINIKD